VVANALHAAAFLLEALLAARAQGWRPRISVREPLMLYRALGFTCAFTNALNGANLWGYRAAGTSSQAYVWISGDLSTAAGTLLLLVYTLNQNLGLNDLAHRASRAAAATASGHLSRGGGARTVAPSSSPAWARRVLLALGAVQFEQTALVCAAQHGHSDVVDKLLSLNASVTAFDKVGWSKALGRAGATFISYDRSHSARTRTPTHPHDDNRHDNTHP
jgi:hypothetical protein